VFFRFAQSPLLLFCTSPRILLTASHSRPLSTLNSSSCMVLCSARRQGQLKIRIQLDRHPPSSSFGPSTVSTEEDHEPPSSLLDCLLVSWTFLATMAPTLLALVPLVIIGLASLLFASVWFSPAAARPTRSVVLLVLGDMGYVEGSFFSSPSLRVVAATRRGKGKHRS
jgi:hypothetical protein